MLGGRNAMERKATQELVNFANRSTEDQHCHLSHAIREYFDNIYADKKYKLRKSILTILVKR